jgi:acetolactate synthase-1/2/3 large subunit
LFLANLIELVGDVKVARDGHFARKAEELKAKRAERYEEKLSSQAMPLKPQHVMRELGKILREGAIVACDSGNNAWWPMMFLESTPDRRFLFPSGNVSMGFGFPAALGARCVSRRVICITGDGGFMMQLAELATSVQEGLNVTVILLNDGGFGAIRHYQRHNFDARYFGVDLHNPDFAKLSESFGAKGITVRTPSELTSGLHEAFGSNETTVLDVKIDPEEVALPDWILMSFCGEIGET